MAAATTIVFAAVPARAAAVNEMIEITSPRPGDTFVLSAAGTVGVPVSGIVHCEGQGNRQLFRFEVQGGATHEVNCGPDSTASFGFSVLATAAGTPAIQPYSCPLALPGFPCLQGQLLVLPVTILPASTDTIPPVISIAAPADGAVIGLGTAASAQYTCEDGGSGVASCTGTVPNGAALDTSSVGQRQLAVTATDQAGNTSTASHSYTVIGPADPRPDPDPPSPPKPDDEAPDTTPPTIAIHVPADGESYTTDDEVRAGYRCSDEPGGSGIAQCSGPVDDGAALPTSTPGDHLFEVTAVDRAGNRATGVRRYSVDHCPRRLRVALPQVDVPVKTRYKPWSITYGALPLTFTKVAARDGAYCSMHSTTGSLPVLLDLVGFDPFLIATSSTVVRLDFMKPHANQHPPCTFLLFDWGEVEDDCFLNTPGSDHVVRWTSPGFRIEPAPAPCLMVSPLICLTGLVAYTTDPKTIYVNAAALGEDAGSTIPALAQAAETLLHRSLIGQLSGVDKIALVQDPPADIAVEDGAGRVTGVRGGGVPDASLPGSLYAAGPLNQAVLLLRPPPGDYRVRLSGAPSSSFDLATSVVDIAAGPTPAPVEHAESGRLDARGTATRSLAVDASPPKLRLDVPREGLTRGSLRLRYRCSEPCHLGVQLRIPDELARKLRLDPALATAVSTKRGTPARREGRVTLKPESSVLKKLPRRRLKLALWARARDAQGNLSRPAQRAIALRR